MGLFIAVLANLLAPPASASIPGVTTPGQNPSNYVIWGACSDVVAMSDATLAMWHSRGVDGFVCDIRFIRGMGGTQDFTTDPANPLSTANYSLQKQIRDTHIVARAKAAGMKLYLGVYLENYYNTATPMMGWFNDAGWTNTALVKFRQLAAGAKYMGFAGLGFDEEIYAQAGGVLTATWKWNFPGNTHAVAEVRAKVQQRGREVMSALVSAFPNLQILDTGARLPETWFEQAYLLANGTKNAFQGYTNVDFWRGLLGVDGYGEVDILDPSMYKTTSGAGLNWDIALNWDLNRFYAYWSRQLPNWATASRHLGRVPFIWIDTGPGTYGKANTPDYVAKQLAAFARWSSGSLLADYSYGSLNDFDYSPYVPGIRSATTSVVVDSVAPTVTVTNPLNNGKVVATAGVAKLTGTGSDNFAIQSLTWTNTTTGASGFGAMTWRILSGNQYTGYVGTTDWTFTASNLKPGDNVVQITTTDIHGLSSTKTVTVAA